jgi:hypothetical protein
VARARDIEADNDMPALIARRYAAERDSQREKLAGRAGALFIARLISRLAFVRHGSHLINGAIGDN